MNTLKEIYHLQYDESGFGSNLVNWYNQLLDKTYEDLTLSDVTRMIRQNIIKDVAIEKAIELFIEYPYAGEYKDGGLLDVLAHLDLSNIKLRKDFKEQIIKQEQKYTHFDWENEEEKDTFAKNLKKMIASL
ncbi:MAG: contact-dependent growth inhibition system immunity protein [Anaerofustis sp.]